MKNKKIGLIIITLIIIYTITFVISESGYYEYRLQNKTILTNEQIQKFEEDVKNNIEVDLNSYVVKDSTDYSNKFTKAVNMTSTSVNKIFKKSIEGVFNMLNNLVKE